MLTKSTASTSSSESALGPAAAPSPAAPLEPVGAAASVPAAESPPSAAPPLASSAAPAASSSIMAARLSANWPMSLALTSAITPRPNWATLPLMVRLVSTVTLVVSSSTAVSCAVITAEALPAPRVSRPLASSTARWLESSRSMKVATPLYSAVIGPTFTLTIPRCSSPSTSWSLAPGRQGAMRSTSVRTAQVSSMDRATSKEELNSMRPGPPRCRCRRGCPRRVALGPDRGGGG